jgi:hypothetical protein
LAERLINEITKAQHFQKLISPIIKVRFRQKIWFDLTAGLPDRLPDFRQRRRSSVVWLSLDCARVTRAAGLD